ncbi:C6 transcription factor [Colletotrichum truncatum]|uniref:C6 transcription factor n=1 Tax=Colletotrichum truncatum TaxID=5467 RepID=A0ACC3YW88_COLTU|nr:C6 transcription factor [Colletotrichum truncatum]KAF6787357.1 C6 transcription factor [Colletotrichum truncatum]
MITVNNTVSQPRGATRSSLACLPCRSRHLKCDGKQPQCSRCVEFEKPCHYAPSRRGGLDRAALAERRKRLAATEDDVRSRNSLESSEFLVSEQESQGPSLSNNYDLPEGIIFGNGTPGFGSAAVPDMGMIDITTDNLVDSYYKNFHSFHPFPLPRKQMLRICQDPERRLSFEPLISAMRLIGHIYAHHKWSEFLKEQLEVCIARTPALNPVLVQCRLLYSIALFWSSYKEEAKVQMDAAAKLAMELQMHRKEFSMNHGMNDSVVAESWRRTWWMLYIVDAYYAGTLGTMNFTVVDVESTVELPCEEAEYDSGVSICNNSRVCVKTAYLL